MSFPLEGPCETATWFSERCKSFLVHQHELSFKLSHCHSEEERDAEIPEEGGENIGSMGHCLAGGDGRELR